MVVMLEEPTMQTDDQHDARVIPVDELCAALANLAEGVEMPTVW